MTSRPLSILSSDDRQFLQGFETDAIAPEDFRHRDHLRAAWAALSTYPLLEAMARFVEALQRLAARAGKPGIYHATITMSYLLLIHERLSRDDAARSWMEFQGRHADLFAWRPEAMILERYYDAAQLFSDAYRAGFVLPASRRSP